MYAVILADKSDPISFLKEVRSALQTAVNEQQRADFSSDLGRSLMQSNKDKTVTEALQGDQLFQQKRFEYLANLEQYTSADEGRKAAIAHLKRVSSILTSKVTVVQAQEFSHWLLALAQQGAGAVKEVSFFGIVENQSIIRKQSYSQSLRKRWQLRMNGVNQTSSEPVHQFLSVFTSI